MDKKICFIVPTFPPHYLFAKAFMDSFNEYHFDEQADLYFVFTSQPERDGFLPCNSIVLPKKLRIMKNRGIINIKKFYALMQLKDKYEYIIVLDDECLFTKTVDLQAICEQYFEEKVLYGNLLENPPWDIMGGVAENCKKFFGEENREKLACPLYLWFNQLPIYRTADLKDFFRITNIGKTISKLTYYDFDYYLYMYYLILYKEFQIVDLGIVAERGIAELEPSSIFKIHPYGFSNSQHLFMATQFATDVLRLKNVFVLVHMDRIGQTQNLVANLSFIKKVALAIKSYSRIKKSLK